MGIQILLAVAAHEDLDLRAPLLLVGRRQGVLAVAGRFPHHPLGVRVGAARGDHHPVGDHEHRVEAHAELPDQPHLLLLVLVLALGQLLQKVDRARVGDGADVLVHLVPGHADPTIADGQRLVALADLDVDLQFGLRIGDILVGQRAAVDLVEGVRGIGYQLAQKDLRMGVQRVDEQVEHLLHFSLESAFLHALFGALGLFAHNHITPLLSIIFIFIRSRKIRY